MEVTLIRHFQTKGNQKRQYIGSTDEGIMPGQKPDKSYPPAEVLVTSPLRRCIETVGLIYPNLQPQICEALRECHFGRFEGKTYDQLKEEPDYQAWLAANGQTAFPEGEHPADFRNRTVAGFRRMIKQLEGKKSLAMVVHGGTIMAVMSEFAGGTFYDWQVENGCGYHFTIAGAGTASQLLDFKEIRKI